VQVLSFAEKLRKAHRPSRVFRLGEKPHEHWVLAQPGRALAWGARGPAFKSARPDHSTSGLSLNALGISPAGSYLTFSSLGIMVSRGPSIVPSLLIVNTTGLGSISPKFPEAMILSPSIL